MESSLDLMEENIKRTNSTRSNLLVSKSFSILNSNRSKYLGIGFLIILILTSLGLSSDSFLCSISKLQKKPTFNSLLTRARSSLKEETFKIINMTETVSYDMRLQSPFTAMIVGPTGSGKTRLLKRLIDLSSTVANPPPSEIIYCYGAYQSIFNQIKDQVTLKEGMIDIDEIPADMKNRWLIIDDLMTETRGNNSLNNLFTKGSHHKNISVFYVTQNMFIKETRTVSLNSHYMFIFKNPRDKSSITNLAKQIFPENVKYVQKSYTQATSLPFSYLMVDMKQETGDNRRLIGNYLGENGTMVVYSPL